MKKIGVLFFTLLLISSFSFVLGDSNDSNGFDDKEKLDNLIGEIPINPDTGKFDPSKFNGTLTKAEERIYEINFWLDSNVGWMKYIFHIKPAISWLFVFNLYFILWFFLLLVLNVQGLFFFMSNKTAARLFGLGLFLVFMITGFYVGLARILESWKNYIFDVLIPASLWLGILLIVVILILMYFAFPLIATISTMIKNYFAAKEEAKKAMELSSGIGAVNKLVDEATK
jgi:hypothetical protein